MKRRQLLKSIGLAGLAAAALPTKVFAEGGCETTSDIEGPFYIAGSAQTTMLAPSGAPGTALLMTGTVYASDCTTPIPNALVDVWAANDAGGYENVDYRGQMMTDANGQYSYETILPGKYLNGSQYRPRHLHYKVSVPGMNSAVLTTQIYFTGDTSIPADPWASDPSALERTVPLTPDAQGREHGVADVTLAIDPILLGSEENGLFENQLSAIAPNPMGKDGGVFHFQLKSNSAVAFMIFNITGKKVWEQDLSTQSAGKHTLKFDALNTLGLSMPAGVYILQMIVDGQAIAAKRFLIQG